MEAVKGSRERERLVSRISSFNIIVLSQGVLAIWVGLACSLGLHYEDLYIALLYLGFVDGLVMGWCSDNTSMPIF